MYSKDLKETVIECIKMGKLSESEIVSIFEIDRKTVYNWKQQYKNDTLHNYKNRTHKISKQIRTYIENYVISRINFNYRKLIKIILIKFDISVSKSSIYNILEERKIKKKNFITKLC